MCLDYGLFKWNNCLEIFARPYNFEPDVTDALYEYLTITSPDIIINENTPLKSIDDTEKKEEILSSSVVPVSTTSIRDIYVRSTLDNSYIAVRVDSELLALRVIDIYKIVNAIYNTNCDNTSTFNRIDILLEDHTIVNKGNSKLYSLNISYTLYIIIGYEDGKEKVEAVDLDCFIYNITATKKYNL